MKQRLDAILAHPTIAHLLRANLRFGNRLGNQFGAAITYFSVLALVPILMFAFSMLGMTLTVLRPDWMTAVSDLLTERLSSETGTQLSDLIVDYLRNWRAVGIVGLVSLAYAGSGWIGNLRNAINAQWRPEFEYVESKRNIVVTTLANLATLLLLLVGVLVTFGMSIGGTALTDWVAGLLNIRHWPGGNLLLRSASTLLTLVAAWLLFMLIFTLLPNDHRPSKVKMVGSVIGAVAFTALQIGASALIGVFSNNRAAALFGPVIILMLFMNLFARIILFIGCWIATDKQPAVAFHYNAADEPLRQRDDTIAADDHWAQADQERAELRADSEVKLSRDEIPSVLTTARPHQHLPYRPKLVTLDDYPQPNPDRMVSEPVAARSVKVGMRAGWVAGTATGLGAGALLVALTSAAKKLFGRKKDQ
ncbi:YihY/virulence factor BrkB family protein [Aestuariimicrobium sp. Y1814]|uniref:YihY/virulence factor BrkB family protein n=1 Tax=Aestuariimicrobium sp. Y1814 TaxID=3418742 RepID=UPI003DA6EC28